MLTGYGVFEDSVVVGNYRIVLEKIEEGVVKYKRYCGDELVVSKTLFKPTRFELIPFYPVFYLSALLIIYWSSLMRKYMFPLRARP